jgi:UDP-N-acetylmuramate--alanine ligase
MLSDLLGTNNRYIHLVGIGGISMSGIAHILLKKGHRVSGSDSNPSEITDRLKQQGATIFEGHNKDHISNPDLVIYTSAVNSENPELIAAQEKNIPIVDRATVLGKLMEEYKYSVAVAGTHGKTTTTSMISLIFDYAGLDPTILIGGELSRYGGNVRTGNGPFFITEACEYKENFLKFSPYAAVILNIDQDHLDYFKDLEHIKSAFERFARLVPDEGWVIAYSQDPNLAEIVPTLSCNVLNYGFDQKARVRADRLVFTNGGLAAFDLVFDNRFIGTVRLSVPGTHNVLNALAAAAVALLFDIEFEVIKNALKEFTGTHRRFEIKGMYNGATIIDDYAHHPTEIEATLEAASNYPHNRIWCVFQPHTYTRTKLLLDQFSHSFSKADVIIVTDIYAAREKDTGDIHSIDLVKAINRQGQRAVYMPNFNEVAVYLANNIEKGDIVFTIGAGNIYKIGEMLLNKDF